MSGLCPLDLGGRARLEQDHAVRPDGFGGLQDDEATHAPTAERDRDRKHCGGMLDLRCVVGVRRRCDVEALLEIHCGNGDAGEALGPAFKDPGAASGAVDEQQ